MAWLAVVGCRRGPPVHTGRVLFLLRKCGWGDRLGMRMFSVTLEMIAGISHIWEADSCLMLGASVRGSNAYTESRGASLGKSTSRNSPGQIVVDEGEERSTMARRAVGLTAAG